MIILEAILNSRQMSWIYVTSPKQSPFNPIVGQTNRALKIHKTIPVLTKKQNCLRHFAQNYKKIYLSEKEMLGL